ncbi:MAG: hypothetical protein ACOZAO_03210 [Patescibacteria group bacterium]
MKTFLTIVVSSLLIFFFSWFLVFKLNINDLSLQSEDTIPALFLPVTLIKERTLYADTYYEMIRERYPHPDDKNHEKGLTPFYFRKVTNGEKHYISAFPLTTGLLAVPIYYLPLKLGMEVTFENLILLGHISASTIVALAGGVFYLLLSKFFGLSRSQRLLLTTIYLFATINFALISQALWQHGTVQLLSLLSLYFLFYGSISVRVKKYLFYLASGLFLGLTILTRPTAALLLPYFGLLLVYKDQKQDFSLSLKNIDLLFKTTIGYAFKLFLLLVGLFPSYLFFNWYTNIWYKSISNNGYANQLFNGWLSRFPEGLLGIWISPSKGILVYSPVFIFIFVSLIVALRSNVWRKNVEYLIYFSIVAVHTLVMSRWKHWYGGWGFGYRMASDVIPFLVLLLIPYLKSDFFKRTKKLFFFIVIFSVLVQIFGIVFFDGIWHAAYDGGFENTTWLWSIKDSEFAFNIRRLLVKVNLLDRACPKCM